MREHGWPRLLAVGVPLAQEAEAMSSDVESSSDSADESRRGSFGGTSPWLFLAVALYVLSPTPLAFLSISAFPEHEESIEAVLSTVYAPLVWLYDNNEQVENFYDWYGNLIG